ncbi:MAG TPA: S8 family serine peptidase [Gemmatimonadaceae bacterium]|nr:S8 family serine peptidase [Gemmatimonadaceae bacterium]
MQFAALAAQLQADLRADLATYDIHDRATLKSYYGTLSDLALLRSDYGTAVAYQDSIHAIEDKPGVRLTTGIVERAMAASARAPSATLDTASFRAAFRRDITTLPYARTQAELATMKSRFELLGPNIILGNVQARIEPAARSGSISRELAQALVRLRVSADRLLPVRQVLVDELGRTLAAHAVVKPDIWAARDVSLDGHTDLAPVVVGIWDTGVDVTVFPGQLFTNSGERPDNGKDDDGNGYVDDLHGIAHDIDGNRATGTLFQLSLTRAEETEYRGLVKGVLDMQAGLENADVDAFRRKVAATPPAELRSFQEKLSEYVVWSHGTHVAGIALRGNPAARMLVARNGTDEFEIPPRPPTLEQAARDAQAMRETIGYFRQHGVRVVNMSWGFGSDFFERDLEANNVGRTAEERRQLAHRIFEIGSKALHEAMADASDILFVVAAGNWDSDNKFSEFVPAAFDLPNLITAAAVDRGGDEAAFTSYGKVDVYANGYEVLSKFPGGYDIPLSGTSMAAPQVVNLAAKLLALKPALSVGELRRAIVESADEKTIGENKKIRLLNPKAAVERIGRGMTPSARPNRAAATLAFTHASVVDVEGGRVLPDQTVVISGNRIQAVGANAITRTPADARVVDATGKYLIPGLWDMHVHLVGDRVTRRNMFPLFIANGITGVRDMWGDCDSACARDEDDVNRPVPAAVVRGWKEAVSSGQLLGPRIIASSAIFEGPPPMHAGSYTIHSPEEAREKVRLAKQHGVDFIKVYAQLSRESYLAIVDEARRQGLPVAGHVPISLSAAEASDAGQRSIEHLNDLLGFASYPSCSSRSKEVLAAFSAMMQPDTSNARGGANNRAFFSLSTESFDSSRCAELFARFARNGTWRVPTLLAERNVFAALNNTDTLLARDPRLRYVDAAVRTAWLQMAANGARQPHSAEGRRLVSTFLQRDAALVGEMQRAGVPILAGTDEPNPFVIPGYALHEELGLLARSGLTPLEALRTATLNPARFLHATDSLGTVASGKVADLILLDANPLDDIRNTAKIRATVLNGRYLDRAALDSLLGQAQSFAARSSSSKGSELPDTATTAGRSRPTLRAHGPHWRATSFFAVMMRTMSHVAATLPRTRPQWRSPCHPFSPGHSYRVSPPCAAQCSS